jgi:uncharacterized protein YlaI
MAIDERAFFNERPETRPATFTCTKCRHRDEYQVKWIRRTKKDRLPSGADERDRAMYAKLRDYMIRVDDVLVCKRCQRKFEIPSQQSIVFIQQDAGHGQSPGAQGSDDFNFNR